jgi:hypothetical protein
MCFWVSPLRRVNLGDVANDRAKALIDGLWPLLGGEPRAPHDHLMTALLPHEAAGGVRPSTGV